MTPDVNYSDQVGEMPPASSGEPFVGEDAMAEATATPIPQALVEQCLARQLSANANAADHNQAFNKILDLNYEMDRKITSLRESLGVREVTSKAGQAGIPLAGGAAGG